MDDLTKRINDINNLDDDITLNIVVRTSTRTNKTGTPYKILQLKWTNPNTLQEISFHEIYLKDNLFQIIKLLNDLEQEKKEE